MRWIINIRIPNSLQIKRFQYYHPKLVEAGCELLHHVCALALDGQGLEDGVSHSMHQQGHSDLQSGIHGGIPSPSISEECVNRDSKKIQQERLYRQIRSNRCIRLQKLLLIKLGPRQCRQTIICLWVELTIRTCGYCSRNLIQPFLLG